jgi:hypothetical protein
LSVRIFFVYVLIGMCWQAIQLYGTGEIGARIRERLAEEMMTAPMWFRIARGVGFAVGLLLWPLWLLFYLAPGLFPKLNERLMSSVRRTYLDRDGLLTPQMPASRCPTHGIAVDMESRACAMCGASYNVGYCIECLRGGTVRNDVRFVCCACVTARKAGHCQWCGNVVVGRPDEMWEHDERVCEEWAKCAASPDPVAYMRDAFARSMLGTAQVRFTGLACEDCGAILATADVVLAEADVQAFEREHAGHRMHGTLADGKAVQIAHE